MTASTSLALSLGLAGIGVFGTLAGGFVGMWSARLLERNRQAFQREQDARRERAQTMRDARILDSALMEGEALLTSSVVKDNRLWVDTLTVPDTTVWRELRGSIAAVLEPPAWFAVINGFLALDHMRDFEAGYRSLGYDHTRDLTPEGRGVFEPILRDIRAAREGLHPVAYPDHIRLPEGHPMLALLAEQRALNPAPPIADSSPEPARGRRIWRRR